MKWTCSHCEGELHHEGGVEYHITDSGKNICEYCLADVIVYSVCEVGGVSEFYGFAEHSAEEISTDYYKSKTEARKRILKMAERLWGDIEKVEK